jgi:hypothetical protein
VTKAYTTLNTNNNKIETAKYSAKLPKPDIEFIIASIIYPLFTG